MGVGDGEGESAPDRDAGRRLIGHLAGKPLRVVLVTALLAVAVTAALVWAQPGMGAVGAISAYATLWALFLALIIYLLTARDTDNLMDRITELQDQLSAALAAPGEDAEVIEGAELASSTEPAPAAVAQADGPAQAGVPSTAAVPGEGPVPAVPDEAAAAAPQPAAHPPAPESATTLESVPGPASADPVPAAAEGMPGPASTAPAPAGPPPPGPPPRGPQLPDGWLAAWRGASGLTPDQIERMWNPDPRGRGPWVIEDKDGNRFSLMRSHRGQVAAIPLGPSRRRMSREESLALAQSRKAARQERRDEAQRRQANQARQERRDETQRPGRSQRPEAPQPRGNAQSNGKAQSHSADQPRDGGNGNKKSDLPQDRRGGRKPRR